MANITTEELESLKIRHHYSEDCWYSCPKSEDGCCDSTQEKDKCNCGADKHNTRVDALIKKLQENG